MKAIKSYILLHFFLLISFFAFANSDSLESKKIKLYLPIYSGVSLGRNNLTYKNGGMLSLGVGTYIKKGTLLIGLDYFYTEFRDLVYPYEEISSIIGGNYTPNHRVSNLSLNLGKHYGGNEKGKFNFTVLIGLGYQEYNRPIVIPNTGCIICLSDSKFKVKEYLTIRNLVFNANLKAYFNNNNLIQTFGMAKFNTSKTMTFWSANLGLELNTNKIPLFN